jgi:hypothetical protein
LAQHDLLDFSTALQAMQQACIIIVCGLAVIAAAFTAARSFAAETGRAARWTSMPPATVANIKNDPAIQAGQDVPHSTADVSTGSSLRLRIGGRR